MSNFKPFLKNIDLITQKCYTINILKEEQTMAPNLFQKIKVKLDKHFNYNEEMINAIVEKYDFNEEQAKRLRAFCKNYKLVTHNVIGYKSHTHKEQQETLTQVINGIKKYPHVDTFNFGITESYQGAAKMENPKVDGHYVDNPELLYTEMNVKAAAIWFQQHGQTVAQR